MWLLTSAAAAIALLAAGCGSPSSNGDGSDKLTIRALYPTPGSVAGLPFEMRAFYYMDQTSKFGAPSVAVKPIQFVNFGQMPVLVSAGKSADMAISTGVSVELPAWSGGAKGFRVIAVGAKSPVYQLVGSKGMRSPSDLENKTIGSYGIDTAGAEAVDLVMGKAGLAGKFKTSSLTSGSVSVAALQAHKLDAAPDAPAISSVLESEGYPILGSMSDIVPNYVTGTTIVNVKWAKEHRDQVVDYLVQLIKIGDYLYDPQNKDAVVKEFQRYGQISDKPLTTEQATSMYDFYIGGDRISRDGYAPQAAVEGNLGVAVKRGRLSTSQIPSDLNKMFDWSYLNAALTKLKRSQVDEYTTLKPTAVEY